MRKEKDDVLRKVANCSDPLVVKVITDTRGILFDEDLVAQDEGSEAEEMKPHYSLSGMGGSADGRGFGNAPISKENIGHKVLDIIDKAVNIPDDKAEVSIFFYHTEEGCYPSKVKSS